jgi:hypothetical protein
LEIEGSTAFVHRLTVENMFYLTFNKGKCFTFVAVFPAVSRVTFTTVIPRDIFTLCTILARLGYQAFIDVYKQSRI